MPRVLLLVMGLIGAVLLTGCAVSAPIALPTPTSAPTPAPLELVVLHTNDTWGYYDPCG